METRVPAWGRDAGRAYEPLRCLLCLGFDVTAGDLLRLIPCIMWSCMALVCAGLFLEYPIVNSRDAHLLPMLGALQSAMPSFMCAALLLMYHRKRVRLFGLPRETAAALGGFYSVTSALGCLVYLTFLMTTVFVFQIERTEEPAYFFLASTWFLVTLLWFILQSCLKPSAKQIEQMINHYEASQVPFSVSTAFPTGAVGVVAGGPVVAMGSPLEPASGSPAPAEVELTTAQTTPEPVIVGQPSS